MNFFRALSKKKQLPYYQDHCLTLSHCEEYYSYSYKSLKTIYIGTITFESLNISYIFYSYRNIISAWDCLFESSYIFFWQKFEIITSSFQEYSVNYCNLNWAYSQIICDVELLYEIDEVIFSFKTFYNYCFWAIVLEILKKIGVSSPDDGDA